MTGEPVDKHEVLAAVALAQHFLKLQAGKPGPNNATHAHEEVCRRRGQEPRIETAETAGVKEIVINLRLAPGCPRSIRVISAVE